MATHYDPAGAPAPSRVAVSAAVVAYGCGTAAEPMLVGYLARCLAEDGATVAAATHRFREWVAFHKTVVQVDPTLRKLKFPSREAIFTHTNKSKKLMEKRRAGLDAFVNEAMRVGNACARAALVAFASTEATGSCEVLSLAPSLAGMLPSSSSMSSSSETEVPAGLSQFDFPRERVSRHYNSHLVVKFPWGYLAHTGAVCVTARSSADAHMSFNVLLEMYSWFARLVDTLPSFVRVTEQVRKVMREGGYAAPGEVPAEPPADSVTSSGDGEGSASTSSLFVQRVPAARGRFGRMLSKASTDDREDSVSDTADADGPVVDGRNGTRPVVDGIPMVDSEASFDSLELTASSLEATTSLSLAACGRLLSGVYAFNDGGSISLSLDVTAASDDDEHPTRARAASCRRKHFKVHMQPVPDPLWYGWYRKRIATV